MKNTIITDSSTKQEDINALIVAKGTKHFEQNVTETEALVNRAKEATAAIEYLVTHTKPSWLDFQEDLKEIVADLRSKKFAIESETRQLLGALGDVRKFFFSDQHEEEMRRLNEFVALCERLQTLKESGFLDAVADTILKLQD